MRQVLLYVCALCTIFMFKCKEVQSIVSVCVCATSFLCESIILPDERTIFTESGAPGYFGTRAYLNSQNFPKRI